MKTKFDLRIFLKLLVPKLEFYERSVITELSKKNAGAWLTFTNNYFEIH
jgi:hypothetical protein